MPEFFLGRGWYYYLNNPRKESLVKVYGKDSIHQGLVISYQDQRTRRYALFRDVESFEKLLSQIRPTDQHFYEVIGSRGQKPHFDIDIDLEEVQISSVGLLKSLIMVIRQVLEEEGVIIGKNNILVYSSNGEKKESYHLIIDGYYHSDNIQAYHFYQRVVQKIPFRYRKVVDGSVYKIIQQFRLLGSSKEGSNRIKKYWNYLGYVPKNPFRSSLISYLEGCQLLPPFREEFTSEEEDNTEDYFQDRELESSALEILRSRFSDHLPFKYEYGISRQSWGLIVLRRTSPSFCQICQRVHENENPYMYISKGNLYLNCRRNTDSLLLKENFLPPREIDFDQHLEEIYQHSPDENTRKQRSEEESPPPRDQKPPSRSPSQESLEVDRLIDLSQEKPPRYKKPVLELSTPRSTSSNHKVAKYLWKK